MVDLMEVWIIVTALGSHMTGLGRTYRKRYGFHMQAPAFEEQATKSDRYGYLELGSPATHCWRRGPIDQSGGIVTIDPTAHSFPPTNAMLCHKDS